jgi:glutamate-5-semialdehyde dehydrogenase
MANVRLLTTVSAGTPIVFGGNKVIEVPGAIAARFAPGDALVVAEATEELLHVPAADRSAAFEAVERAASAFEELRHANRERIDEFYRSFARRLETDAIWHEVATANTEDVKRAKERGRSTTRLAATEKMRRDMIGGLREWVRAESRHGQVLETIEHDGWRAELVAAPLGVVGFVFEGRPNVLADATGVLRGGNTVVFRIGSDALGTARTLMDRAVRPALADAGLPEGTVSLLESASHASGWALFSDARLALAVARGSGRAVAALGSLARQAGIPVSLHGTGGAWLVAAEDARAEAFADAVFRSLDRKVCNTLNTCCITRSRASALVPRFLDALDRAAARLATNYKLHVVEGDESFVPRAMFAEVVRVTRAHGEVLEARAERLGEDLLGHEWEWELSPEVTLKIVDDVDHGVALFNRHSPQFVACLISDDENLHRRFYETVNAPFVGDGFTRWVDGQYALGKPELGLSNWQWGRLFGRGGVLSGDTVYTVRTRVKGTSLSSPT